ncbi:FHA domain-containing protein, partial [Georgenia ruanii]|nr:FHA domain-containing protein [Georgenia ruanii]
MPFLEVLGPGIRGRRIPLVREALVLGNAPTCDVCLEDPDLSPQHAAVRRVGETVLVEDLGSRLGTFLDGVAVTAPSELHAGDVVTLGDVRLRYGQAPAEPATAGPADPLAVLDSAETVTTMEPEVYAELVVHHREQLLGRAAVWLGRARRLFWVGAAVVALGGAAFAVGMLAFLGWPPALLDVVPRPPDMFGWALAGRVLSGHVAWAVGLAGLLTVLLALLVHVLARSRARRITRTIPPPPTSWHLTPHPDGP